MPTLPAEFADLEPFSDWCLQSERDRYAKRLASTMAGAPGVLRRRLPAPRSRLEYLDQYELDALPDDAKHLLWLCYSLVNVSFPVEVWRQPRVPDSGAARIDQVVEPAI